MDNSTSIDMSVDSNVSYEAFKTATLNTDDSITLSDSIGTTLLSDIIKNNYYFYVDSVPYCGGFVSYSESEPNTKYTAWYGYKCSVKGTDSKGDILCGLVTGDKSDTYPEDGKLVDNWYTLVTGDVDLLNECGVSLPTRYQNRIGSSTGVQGSNQWFNYSYYLPDSDYDYDNISLPTHPTSTGFNSSYDYSHVTVDTTVDIPSLNLKCLVDGLYVITLCFNEYHNRAYFNRQITLNGVDISYTSKLNSDYTSNIYQYAYWLKLKKGDIFSVKHVSGEESAALYASSTYKTITWGDDQGYIYWQPTKSSHDQNYTIEACIWNCVPSVDDNQHVSYTIVDRSSNFEAVAE